MHASYTSKLEVIYAIRQDPICLCTPSKFLRNPMVIMVETVIMVEMDIIIEKDIMVVMANMVTKPKVDLDG